MHTGKQMSRQTDRQAVDRSTDGLKGKQIEQRVVKKTVRHTDIQHGNIQTDRKKDRWQTDITNDIQLEKQKVREIGQTDNWTKKQTDNADKLSATNRETGKMT